MNIKKIILIIIFLILLLICIILIKNNVEDQKNIVTVLGSLDNYYDKSASNVINKKISFQTSLLKLDGNAKENTIGVLEEGVGIIILGRTPNYFSWMYGKEYYLVNTHQSQKCWTGWIKKDSVDLTEEEEEGLNSFDSSYFSNNNKYYAFSTGWMKSLIIIDNDGKTVMEVKLQDLVKLDPNSVDSSIIGWNNDSTYVWFDTNMDAYTSSFGRININKKTFELLKRPNNFRSYQIIIDLNNGNTIYTDYPYQFDTLTSEKTRKSGEMFNLYKNNLINPQKVCIDTNSGEGFILFKDKDNKLLYKKNEDEKYKKVTFSDLNNSSRLEKRILNVITNLRLRKTSAISSNVIITMQEGTLVKIIKVGKAETIDGINGNWVEIEVLPKGKDKNGNKIKPGTKGWCFSGYLE